MQGISGDFGLWLSIYKCKPCLHPAHTACADRTGIAWTACAGTMSACTTYISKFAPSRMGLLSPKTCSKGNEWMNEWMIGQQDTLKSPRHKFVRACEGPTQHLGARAEMHGQCIPSNNASAARRHSRQRMSSVFTCRFGASGKAHGSTLGRSEPASQQQTSSDIKYSTHL